MRHVLRIIVHPSLAILHSRRLASALGAACTLLLLPATSLFAQTEDSEAEAPEIDPLLPEEGLLDPETWLALGRRLLTNAVDWLPRLFAALFVFAVFWFLARIVGRFVRVAMSKTQAEVALVEIFTRLVRVVVLLLGVVMAASQAGINVASLIAGLGVAGLAVGLAAQDSLSNIVAGLTILWDRPFRVGDMVTVDDVYGEVNVIGLRTTRIRTLSRLDVILPNKDVVDSRITNHTLSRDLRLGVGIGIAYGENIQQAREAILGAVRGLDNVKAEPQPAVVVTELADSSVNLEVRVFLEDPHKESPTSFRVREAIKVALDDAGIEIPFPQRVLHMAAESAPITVDSGAKSAAPPAN